MNYIKFIILALILQLLSCKANPNNLRFIQYYNTAIELGGNQDKPIFIYFTCSGCMGYDEFNRDFVRSKEIQKKLNNEFITVILNIDNPKKLSKSKREELKTFRFIKKINLDGIETEGELNRRIQKVIFKGEYQPMYVFLNARQSIIFEPYGYMNKDQEKFIDLLYDIWRDY